METARGADAGAAGPSEAGAGATVKTATPRRGESAAGRTESSRAATGAAWYFLGTYYGVGVAVVGGLIYATLVRRIVHRKLEQRVETVAMADTSTWRKLWRFGGVVLIAQAQPGGQQGGRCEAPKDNWMTFLNGLAGGKEPAAG